MGLIPKILSVVLLVGCLDLAVAMAGKSACDGPYKGRTLTPEELATVLRNHRAWQASGGEPDDKRRANLCQANLIRADLQGVDLSGADLFRADLQDANLCQANLSEADLQDARLVGADLSRADLQDARLIRADLSGAHLQGALVSRADLVGANLFEANLQDARLVEANLDGALLLGTNLQRANLIRANLARAIYEPEPEKLPHLWALTDPDNELETLVFHQSPAALIALREAFKKAGMRTQERQLTYAIERGRRLQAWNPSWYDTNVYDEYERPFLYDGRPWLEQLAGKSESLFTYVLFELPSHYGMAPGRALWGLFGFIPGFAVFYWIALQYKSSGSGLWMIVPADRLTKGRGHERIVRIRPQTAKTWTARLMSGVRLLRTSLYFSLLSAFHLGWREFNVGSWITRMQPREYTLRATGWIRMVSGIQSLLSVYLLALWVLTYFGRPFE